MKLEEVLRLRKAFTRAKDPRIVWGEHLHSRRFSIEEVLAEDWQLVDLGTLKFRKDMTLEDFLRGLKPHPFHKGARVRLNNALRFHAGRTGNQFHWRAEDPPGYVFPELSERLVSIDFVTLCEKLLRLNNCGRKTIQYFEEELKRVSTEHGVQK